MTQSERNVPGRLLDDPDVRALCDACCDGLATPQQRAEMSDLIASSPEVLDYVVAHSFMISQLVAISETPEEVGSGVASLGPPRVSRRMSMRKVLAIAASIAIAVAGVELWRGGGSGAPSLQAKLAVVGRMHRVTDGSSPPEFVNVNERTRVDIDEGEYEVSLSSGVKLTVAGPGNFVVDNPMYCRLGFGRMTASVPKGAEGFRVHTGDAEIVDHGTRFGVAVDPNGGTDVAVFEGKVEVLSRDEQRKLSIGRAVSVTSNGAMSRMLVVKPDSFEVSKRVLSSDGPAITSVRDNIRSSDEMGYYRIVNEGFGEDQPAYVDRVHQWNGLGRDGLPKELLGADYILPFNDDKTVREIEITVTLARVSDVYVLLDARVNPPAWLVDGFVETELSVGMDEGERPGHPEDPRRTSVGAGNSIDYRFSVWKRKRAGVGTVTFGGLPQIGEFMSMYGILAVPLSESSVREIDAI
ncbi:FecR family protein [Rhodopirellula sp. SWK7]|uniref:FecR family protein n=1 Tax=Rhodopirellula sp. SWK7 TaxID=595460 RepID=UPI0005C67B6F|nr:FecR family protein [Rhodopirellula sp. SWK7]